MHIDWHHPSVQRLVFTVLDRLVIRRVLTVESAQEKSLRRVLDRLNTLEQQVKTGSNSNPIASQAIAISTPTTAGGNPADIRQSLTNASAMLKEAGRFAREDGMAHPEVQMRLSDTEAILTDLERFQLAPERMERLPEPLKRDVRAMLPEIRRLRQQVYNQMNSAESLDRAAGLAGDLTTRFRAVSSTVPGGEPLVTSLDAGTIAKVISAMPGDSLSITANPTTGSGSGTERPYSLYAPEMEIDTGCIPCGRAHLGAVQAELEGAANDAKMQGMQSPIVQARLASAEEELAALFAYDWTLERIQRSPDADKRILEEFKPRVESLQGHIATVDNPDDLARLAVQAHDLRSEFRQATNAGGRSQTSSTKFASAVQSR